MGEFIQAFGLSTQTNRSSLLQKILSFSFFGVPVPKIKFGCIVYMCLCLGFMRK